MQQRYKADRNHPLMEAARYNDAQAQEGGVKHALERLGLTWDDAMYVAEQRALRVVLMQRGDGSLEAAVSGQPFRLEHSDEAAMRFIALASLDGIALGWNAARIEGRS